MRAEIASCGSRTSAQVGVPMASSNHASTSLGSARSSPDSRPTQRHDVHAVVVQLRAARGFGQVEAHLRQ
jgi:hypothetical protein